MQNYVIKTDVFDQTFIQLAKNRNEAIKLFCNKYNFDANKDIKSCLPIGKYLKQKASK